MSALPAVLDALVSRFSSALPAAQVIDGPPTVDVAGDVVAVGLAPDDPSPADATQEAVGLSVRRESFDVMCLARSWSGNDGVKAQRDRTFLLLASVQEALRDDPSLGGIVLGADFGGYTYSPYLTPDGFLVVDVSFRVSVTALL